MATATTASIVILISACSSHQVRQVDAQATAMQGFQSVDDLYVVDCLLPGEVRRMGRMTYVSPRVPIKTSARDCQIRGGEYVLYNRADYRSALRVWLAQAEAGNAKAQVITGEIYERGLGTPADYKAAAHWYTLAAKQGNTRAERHLGYLYEQGLGVEEDLVAALSWYRKSIGAKDGDLMLAATAHKKISRLRNQLKAQVRAANRQRDTLQQQIQTLQSDQGSGTKGNSTQTIRTLQQQLAQTKARLAEKSTRLQQLSGVDIHNSVATRGGEPVGPSQWAGVNFGHYYALIIALQDYKFWSDLATPKADAKAIADILTNKYGFRTKTIVDANAYDILAALNDLREEVGKDDNVLIYFAGHGQIRSPIQGQRTGYWLPVNAQKDRTTFWLPNSQINEQLAMLKARSVLVVADSCYAGALSTDPASLLMGGRMQLSKRLLEVALHRRARYVLSSGGLHPVLDGGGGQHSVFAAAFIHLLQSNHGLLTGHAIVQDLGSRVARRAAAMGADEHPELRPIRAAGHEPGGRFFLVPQARQTTALTRTENSTSAP